MSGKASERWLAYAVRELVAKSYPSLCIAYIDLENVGEAKVAPLMSPHEQQPHSWELSPLMEEPRNRSRGSKPYQLLRQYSVLLQYSNGAGQDTNRPGVRELYRWGGQSWSAWRVLHFLLLYFVLRIYCRCTCAR